MGRYQSSGNSDITHLLAVQAGLITRRQVFAAGMTESALRHRIRPDGPWSVVLPGVYCATSRPLSFLQQQTAATLYAGDHSFITGLAALLPQGAQVPAPEVVDVLVPLSCGKQSYDFIRLHRTGRLPTRSALLGTIKLAPIPRATADAIRAGMEPRAARALVASTVQRRLCTVDELIAESIAGPARGLPPLRDALTDAIAGNRSVAEGDLRRLITRGGIPAPLYNPRLLIGTKFLAEPDAWWPDAGVAAEVDSVEYHFSQNDWNRTQERHDRMIAAGILVLHFAPSRLRRDGPGVVAQIRETIGKGLLRPPLPITTIPAAPGR